VVALFVLLVGGVPARAAGPDAGRAGVGPGVDVESAPLDAGSASRDVGGREQEPDSRLEGGSRPGGGDSDVREARRLADVELVCDLPRCDDPVEVDKILDIAGLSVGRTYSASLRKIARERLRKTELFEEIEFDARPTAEGRVSLTVRSVGARRIRTIRFRGVNPPPFRSDLRKLLIYREGEIFEDDTSKKNTQLGSLEAEFEEEGFFGTEIELAAEPVGGDQKFIDLVFRVDKGERLKVCDIGIRGLEALTYTEARRAVLQKSSFFARRLELVRPPFTTDLFDAGQESLVQEYRRRGYFQARIEETAVQKSFDEGCVTLLLAVDEGPLWTVEFRGNSVFEDRKLRGELPFLESGYVDDEELGRAERAIEQMYETRGRPFAEVEAREVREDRLSRRLEFDIEEGRRLPIGAVDVDGNETISEKRLLEEMGTKPFELFGSGGFLQTERLLADFRAIEKLYRDRGYLRAAVDRYSVDVRPDSDDLSIRVHVDEGERTETSAVIFEGIRSVTRSRAERRIEVGEGDPFVPVGVRADGSRLTQMYGSIGYPLASVEVACQTPAGEEVPCARPKYPAECVADSVEALEANCEWRSVGEGRRRVCRRIERGCEQEGGVGERRRVQVVHRVDEGPLITTGSFLLQGNFRTHDRVVFREIPLESDEIFDVREMLRGQSNLRSLGIFDSVSIEAIGLDELATGAEQNRASVLVSVEEARNRFLQFKFGFEGRDLLNDRRRFLTTGEVEYTDRNLFGGALEWEPKVFAAGDLLQLSRESGALLGGGREGSTTGIDYLVGVELPLRDPRFLKGALGIEKLQLTVTPFYLIDLLGVNNDRLLREEWGLASELQKELSGLLERFFVSFGVELKQTATAPVGGPVVQGDRVFSPRRVTGKLIPELTLDRRDSPLNPSSGYFLQFQPELVSGDALSGEVDTVDDSYMRVTLRADGFVPLGEETVLAQSFRAGQAIPLFGRDVRIPADERYFLGGAGSLRGYPNNSLGPRLGGQPAGGEFLLNYSLEFRYPLISAASLRGATFVDTGLLVDCFGDGDITRRVGCYEDAFGSDVAEQLRASAGIGLRYILAEQIPLVLDYGVPLDRRGTEAIGNLHFRLGYTF